MLKQKGSPTLCGLQAASRPHLNWLIKWARLMNIWDFFFFCLKTRAGEILQKCKILITGFYNGWLRDITDITDFYCGYYGAFPLGFVESGPRPRKKLPGPSYLKKTMKIQPNLLRILRNITDITEFAITEYYGTVNGLSCEPGFKQ